LPALEQRKEKDLLINAGIGAVGLTAPRTFQNLPNAPGAQPVNQGTGGGPERSLERNPSVLSRKELIQQEYNLLLETRLPNIMQLMNSEKNLGLGLGYNRPNVPDINESAGPGEIKDEAVGTNSRGGNYPNPRLGSNAGRQLGKQSVDYDDLK